MNSITEAYGVSKPWLGVTLNLFKGLLATQETVGTSATETAIAHESASKNAARRNMPFMKAVLIIYHIHTGAAQI